jgi:RecB family endonuclease NucS
MGIKPIVMLAKCEVAYEGRATSTLESGNYLIIIKSDGSILIHGNNLLKPKNYMGPKAKIVVGYDSIVATKKKETITVTITEAISKMDIEDWSATNIELKGSEAELRDKIAESIKDYIGEDAIEVIKEFKTTVGSVDICAIDSLETYHIIEVKRGKASLSAVSQLHRYMENIGKPRMRGYLIARGISSSALTLLESHGYKFIDV